MTKYVLLMRHGKHEKVRSSTLAFVRNSQLSETGEKETRAVAGRLTEVLKELQGGACHFDRASLVCLIS